MPTADVPRAHVYASMAFSLPPSQVERNSGFQRKQINQRLEIKTPGPKRLFRSVSTETDLSPYLFSPPTSSVTTSRPPAETSGITLASQPNIHPYFSSCFYTGWIVEQMVLGKLAYNMETSKTTSSYKSGPSVD